MSAEAIDAARPRAAEPAQRPIDSAAHNAGAPAEENAPLLERLQATTPGEGSRGEDSTSDHGRERAQTLPSATLTGVEYPSAVPSLPPPLVPIREVPRPEAAEDDRVREQIEQQRAEQTGEAERSERLAPTAEAAASEASEPEPEVVAGAGESEPADGRRDFGSEQTLQSVVLSQARDAAPVEPVDSEFAGRIVSVKS